MEENKNGNRINFFLDVLKMVRLLALYFCLYYLSILFFSNTALRNVPQYVSILSFAICGFVTFIFLPKEHKNLRFSCRRKGFALPGILLLSVGLTVLLNIVINLIPWDAFLPEKMQYSPKDTFAIPLAVSVIGYGFIAPFAEEVCFRGIIFKYMQKWIPAPLAIILSAVLFGLYHGNVTQGLYAAFMGLIMAYLVHKTGSLAASILFHMTSNLIVTLYANIPKLYHFLITRSGIITMAFGTVAGIVLLALSFSAKEKDKETAA